MLLHSFVSEKKHFRFKCLTDQLNASLCRDYGDEAKISLETTAGAVYGIKHKR